MWNGSVIKRKRNTTTRKRRRQQKLELPQDIILWNILPRLPVKSLLRFKFVCKEWKSFITDNRDFAKLQLDFQHYNQTYDQYYLVQGYPTELSSNVDCTCCCSSLVSLKLKIEPSNREVVVDKTRNFSSRNVKVVGSSNGLICLSQEVCDSSTLPSKIKGYEVWNPATGSRWLIPAPPSAGYYIISQGFGYIPSLDDYKIVILRELDCSSLGVKVHHAVIFSCRTNTWKQIKQKYDDDNGVPISGYASMHGVQIGESLHWGMSMNIFPHPIHRAVLAFNLTNDSVRWLRFSLPSSCKPVPFSHEVSKFRGRLCVSWKDQYRCNDSYKVDVICMLDDDGLNWKHIFNLDNVDRFGLYDSFLEVNNINDDGTTTAVVIVNEPLNESRNRSTEKLQFHPLVFSGDCYKQLNPLVFSSDRSILSVIDYIQSLITPFTSKRGPITLLPMVDL